MPIQRILHKWTVLTTMGSPIQFQSLSRVQLYTPGFISKPMSCQRYERPRNEPFLELLIDGHQLDILILLHIIPRSGVRLGPNNYGDGLSIRRRRTSCKGGLTMRATREVGEVPTAAEYGGANDDVAAG